MTMPNLPAHLQGLVPTGMTARAADGMGSSLPPHISIQGNKFTFVDASGNEAPPMLTFDGYIIDISDHMNKRFYKKKYDQNATTYEPPNCWSSNGVGPSREATEPQSMTCEACPQNVRGSAISQMSGAAIKACRDERWIAVMVPALGPMVFQAIISPGSFKNWKAYIAGLEHHKVEPFWVLTRFSFEDKTNGVLQFTMINYTAAEHLPVIQAALAEHKSDAIVGRLDQPRTAAIAGPVQQGAMSGGAGVGQQMQIAPQAVAQNPGFGAPAQEVIPPGAQGNAPFTPGPAPGGFAPPAASPQTATATGFVGTAPMNAAPASPSEQPAPQQRRRRNAAAAAPAQNAAPPAPQAQQGGFQTTAAPQAPFGQPVAGAAPGGFAPAQPAPAPAGNNFGIAQGAPVNPEMSAMLTNLFTAPPA